MRLSFSVKQQPDVSAHYPVECECGVSVYCINLHDLRGIQSDRVPPVKAREMFTVHEREHCVKIHLISAFPSSQLIQLKPF